MVLEALTRLESTFILDMKDVLRVMSCTGITVPILAAIDDLSWIDLKLQGQCIGQMGAGVRILYQASLFYDLKFCMRASTGP